MASSEEDFKKIGLTNQEWKAIIFDIKSIDPAKLDRARATVAQLGRYSQTLARDTSVTDHALKLVATQYAYLWNQGEKLTYGEKIIFMQAREGWTRDETIAHLQKVNDRSEIIARIERGEGK